MQFLKPNRRRISFFTLAACWSLLLISSVNFTVAWSAEVKVDGQIIPTELFDGYISHTRRIENACPPVSDINERDAVIRAWIRVSVALARSLDLSEEYAERIAKYQLDLESDQAINDIEFRNKTLWFMLNAKAYGYWDDKIDVSELDIQVEYDRLVKAGDSSIVNAPFFQWVQMESDNIAYLQQLADRLHAGESWRQVSVDVDPYDWNSHIKEHWYNFERLDTYNSKSLLGLKLNGSNLVRGDVIGPLSEVGRYRLVVILDKTTVPLVPLNGTLDARDKKWAARKIKWDLIEQHLNVLNKALIEEVNVTVDGLPVTVLLESEECPV